MLGRRGGRGANQRLDRKKQENNVFSLKHIRCLRHFLQSFPDWLMETTGDSLDDCRNINDDACVCVQEGETSEAV